ncbi:hypothetical protein ACFPRL_20315 [Pseudoclavibacter helvolus]
MSCAARTRPGASHDSTPSVAPSEPTLSRMFATLDASASCSARAVASSLAASA